MIATVTDNDPEVKMEAWLGLCSEVNHEFLDPKKTSLWTYLTQAITWVFQFVRSCSHKNDQGPLSVEELMSAKEFWIKRAQAQASSNDLSQLAAGNELNCSSDRSLYPYTDKKGILHVRGRMEHAPIPYQACSKFHRHALLHDRIFNLIIHWESVSFPNNFYSYFIGHHFANCAKAKFN